MPAVAEIAGCFIVKEQRRQGKREPLASYRRGEGWGNVACA